MARILDKATIDKVLQSIPMTDPDMSYASLADRLPNLGLQVKSITVSHYTKLDFETPYTREIHKPGDVQYDFDTNQPNDVVKQLCPILSLFELTRRGNGWITEDRSANFLVNGLEYCYAPRK